MSNLKMFCLTLEATHKEFIKELGYIPVGLGEKKEEVFKAIQSI